MPLQRIGIKPSMMLALALCVVGSGAAAAIWLAVLPLWLKGGLTVAIAAGTAWSLPRQAALRAAESVVAVEITAKGRISLLTRRGTWHACELLGTSYVSPCLTILNLRFVDRRLLVRHVVLVPDNVDARDYRCLRTWLRWAPRASPAAGAGPTDVAL